MPKLNLSIHVNEHGLQTIASDGDPSLWPLVGRLAAAASPIQQPTVVINNMSGENTQTRRSPAERLSWGRYNGAGVSLTLDGNTVLIAGELAEKLAEVLSPRQDREHKIRAALVTLGWDGVSDLQAWAEMTAEIETRRTEALTVAEQVDRIDDLLRPLVLVDEGDGPEAVASAAAALIKSLEADNAAVRAVLDEAIGRTPDPSRSTLQLAHDLAATLAHAIR